MTTMSRIITGPDTVTSDDAGSVRVQLVGGALEVVPRDGTGVVVEVTEVVGQPLEIATEADRISVGYPSIGWDGWLKRLTSSDSADRAVVRLHVGTGVSLTAATVNAPISISGTTGDVDLSTASAPVAMDRTVGGVKVRTASGAVGVEDHRGPVTISGASGAVRLDGDLPKTTVTSVSGNIALRHRGSASLMTLTSVSGRVELTVPHQAHLELEVRGVSARVRVEGREQSSGFGITRVDEAGPGDRVIATVSTVSGDVSVERATAWPLPPSGTQDA
ncbi:DUF4097 family beta strand repeat-containing protein [Pseudactinotalea terrae]|uniref:DUF4097 family beta strand repeat-containing protein n=1 Tax=Pseudactinotalea terrae TaxID=1743262 RepID=UPI0012E23AF4|nr:DUF4097 family beta strand repeat-containing protein [Pseudactinotalea terrae]